MISRRSFLRTTAITGGAALTLQGLMLRGLMKVPPAEAASGSYGPLSPKAANNTGEVLLTLPAGFQYTVIGKRGSLMSDGRLTPGSHDGMATFGMPDGSIRLIRNHEQGGGSVADIGMAYGARPYDANALGGTTTLVVDPLTREITRDFASLSGTIRNCAGGPTPWGTWISNEETTVFPNPSVSNAFYEKVHGYNFEVAAAANGEVTPFPLKAMGRFSHEAVTVDPETNIVYETEDANPSGFYRFVPSEPNVGGRPNFAAGGLLQMLAVKNVRRYDTRIGQTQGQVLQTYWVDIKNPDPQLQNGALSVVNQGRSRGGAVFARLEGAWYGDNSTFIVSTNGGNAGQGQVWQFTPTSNSEGELRLVFESPSADILNSPDNICVSPRGGLVLCEDGSGEEFLHGLTLDGQIFKFAQNIVPGFEGSEVAGATFSPDGETLFFNIQGPGLTMAVWPEAGRLWTDGAL